jgi:hypothetical protein
MQNKDQDTVVIYQGRDGDIELRADIKQDTIWATQAQMAHVFEVDIRTVNEHLNNIFRTHELSKDSTLRKFRIVQSEGGRRVERMTNFYNLDAIIAVGYRINSKRATQFRIWSTRILREYLVNGYSLNRYRLDKAPERLEGLNEAIAMIESADHPGRVKGKITIKLTKDLIPRT